jgi:hypothetical protein
VIRGEVGNAEQGGLDGPDGIWTSRLHAWGSISAQFQGNWLLRDYFLMLCMIYVHYST